MTNLNGQTPTEVCIVGQLAARINDAAEDAFYGGLEDVTLQLVKNDQAYSYEDTWHITVAISGVLELRAVHKFIAELVVGTELAMGGGLETDFFVVPEEPGLLQLHFAAWAAEIEGRWGTVPDEGPASDVKPWPGMEFERPDSDPV